METVFDFFINLAIQYQSIKIVGIILMAIGTLYVFMILVRPVLWSIAKATHTDKDNKILEKIYNFLDKYSFSFIKLEQFSKLKKEENK